MAKFCHITFCQGKENGLLTVGTMAKFSIFVSLIVSQIVFDAEVTKVRIIVWVYHLLKPISNLFVLYQLLSSQKDERI